MIADLSIFSFASFAVKIFNRGTNTQVGSSVSAVAIGTSRVRWTLDLGLIDDGEYDLEHESGYGVWALVVKSGVATIYDDWQAASDFVSQITQGVLGASAAVNQLPIPGDVSDQIINGDLDVTFPVASQTGARLVLSIGCVIKNPSLVADSADGLISVNALPAEFPEDASVIRLDANRVRVLVLARSLELLAAKSYSIELRELIGVSTKPLWEGSIFLRRSAGREISQV